MTLVIRLRRPFEFSAERLSENAKTINLSSWKLPILQCVQVQVQEALKSPAEKPKISDQVSWSQIFWHFAFKWSMFETFYWFTHEECADFFVFRMFVWKCILNLQFLIFNNDIVWYDLGFWTAIQAKYKWIGNAEQTLLHTATASLESKFWKVVVCLKWRCKVEMLDSLRLHECPWWQWEGIPLEYSPSDSWRTCTSWGILFLSHLHFPLILRGSLMTNTSRLLHQAGSFYQWIYKRHFYFNCWSCVAFEPLSSSTISAVCAERSHWPHRKTAAQRKCSISTEHLNQLQRCGVPASRWLATVLLRF